MMITLREHLYVRAIQAKGYINAQYPPEWVARELLGINCQGLNEDQTKRVVDIFLETVKEEQAPELDPEFREKIAVDLIEAANFFYEMIATGTLLECGFTLDALKRVADSLVSHHDILMGHETKDDEEAGESYSILAESD